jgi:hypothetical protein
MSSDQPSSARPSVEGKIERPGILGAGAGAGAGATATAGAAACDCDCVGEEDCVGKD